MSRGGTAMARSVGELHSRPALPLAMTVIASAVAVVVAAVPGAAIAGAMSVTARTVMASQDWPAYLDGPQHNSYARSQNAITPASSRRLVQAWHYGAGTLFRASPTVSGGAVFIGSDTGWFYKLKQTTGAVLARRFIGHEPAKTCAAIGTVSTATVATDPVTHRGTVYVAGADGYLYALNASNLTMRWKAIIALPSPTASDYFDWSSPTVANGRIYVGVSSQCDKPQVRGGVIAFSQATGRKLAEFYTVPAGDLGGSVWSSVAVAPSGDLFVSTGDGPATDQLLGYSDSIVKLNPRTLSVLDQFQVPAAQIGPDSDFGQSPVVFGSYVGACNKDGIFYLLSQASMTLRWEERIGDASHNGQTGQCIATPAFNGKLLYFGGNETTINGVTYLGSVQARKPGSGALVWETPLADGVTGSPSIDGGGVLAVPAYYPPAGSTPDAVYLVDAASGRILRVLAHGEEFAQPVFAGGWMFSADSDGVYAWR
jgi:outer membrane protein assembly factor BamB